MLLRRIFNQWRLELCLFLGLLVAMAVAIAVPLYTNGALQDSLTNEMKRSAFGNAAPFTYSVNITEDPAGETQPLTRKRVWTAYQYLQKYPLQDRLKTSLVHKGWTGLLSDTLDVPDPQGSTSSLRTAQVFTITGLDTLVEYQEGRAAADKVEPDGTVEMVCAVKTADTLGLVVGKTYTIKSEPLAGESRNDPKQKMDLRFRLAGTFKLRPDRFNSSGWLISPDFSHSIFVNPTVFIGHLIRKRGVAINSLEFTWIMEYREVRVQDLSRLTNALQNVERELGRKDRALQVSVSPLDVFNRFSEVKKSLQMTMLSLALPTLVLVIYYILLMAGLIVEQRRGEIAMLRGRGAGNLQLTGMFVLEWAILSLGCFVAGPPVGLFLAQIVGASSGFLNFVDRQSLPITMTGEAYIYAAILAVVMIAAASIPAALACRKGIIEHKQDRSRSSSKPFWQRFYLDFLLLVIGIYGYRLMSLQAQAAEQSSATLEKLMDPLLFIVPVLVVFSGGLLVLRVLPFIMEVAVKLTGRRKGVALYTSLLQMSRNMAGFRPLILLIVLTIATGIYSAAMARTLDQNIRDRIYYAAGTDVILDGRWYRIYADFKNAGGVASPLAVDKRHAYEPPFSIYRTMPGVIASAKVQLTNNVIMTSANSGDQEVNVMAIEPYDFGQTAWFRPGLTPLHQNYYLNLLTQYPQSALVSNQLLKKGGLKIGDTIAIKMVRGTVHLVVAGGLDYWPALYEDERPFVIGNLNYIQVRSSVHPYQIWLRMKPGTQLNTLLENLSKAGVTVTPVTDSRRELALSHQDPIWMGLYGIMSISFYIAVLITVIGYILYTFISLQKRLLQFGVLRAIGLSLQQLAGILSLEQLWSAGIGLIIGTLEGLLISWLFVPYLRTATAMTRKIPPFQVVVSGMDILTIYSILLPILILALAGLALRLARQQIHQAVKLGEES
jgi:putative ABC transport system permease protein